MASKITKKQVESRAATARRKRKFQADMGLPRVEIKWTERELHSLAELVSAAEANRPTADLLLAMRD